MSFSVFPHLDMPLSCFFLLVGMSYPYITQIHMLSFLQTSFFGMPFFYFQPYKHAASPAPEFLFPPCTTFITCTSPKNLFAGNNYRYSTTPRSSFFTCNLSLYLLAGNNYRHSTTPRSHFITCNLSQYLLAGNNYRYFTTPRLSFFTCTPL